MTELAIDGRNITVEFEYSDLRHSTLKEWVMNRLRGVSSSRKLRALDSVDLQVAAGESVALIGHNGSGKSTLLKVLAGILEPPGATVVTRGRIAPMIELGTGFDGELSGRENIRMACMLMGLTRDEIDARYGQIIDFSELGNFIDMPFKNYSSGMQARLGFACATAVDPDILLVDEILSVGDQSFSKKCLRRIEELRHRGCTIVLVSHDPGTVGVFCQRGYVFESGKIKFSGDITEALARHSNILSTRSGIKLSERDMEAYKRRQELEKNDIRDTFDGAKAKPSVDVTVFFKQNEISVGAIDLAKPFSIIVEGTIKDTQHFENDVSIGLGINTSAGVRVTGINNLEKKVSLEFGKGDEKFSLCYAFDKGIPMMASGVFQLWVGVHDRHLRRTIFCEMVTQFWADNSALGINVDQDIFNLSDYVQKIELTTSSVKEQT